MKAWEKELGRPLNCGGFQPEDEGHLHLRVVVFGYAGSTQVGPYERDLNKRRVWAEREKGRQAELTRGTPVQERSARDETQRLLQMVRPAQERIHGRDATDGRRSS